MEKVAIIGGGIAGLTCAYRLSQKGVKSVTFEKELMLGGRLQWSGITGGAALHPYTYKLVQELDLEEVIIRLRLTDLGLLMPDNTMMKMEDLPKIMQTFSPEEAAFFQKIGGFFAGTPIDVKNISPNLAALRDISFAEYMKECPEKLKPLLGLELNFRWLKSWEEVSAEYGIICVAPFFTVIPKEEVYMFEENMMIIANVLAEKIKEAGSEVRTDTEVQKVEKTKSGFKISFQTGGEVATQEAEQVVFTTPLLVTEKLFPALKLKSGVRYTDGKCVLVRGEIKPEYNRKALFVFPGHRSNTALIFAMIPEEHRVYPLDPTKKIDLGDIYKEVEVLAEKELIPAWPIVPPGAQIPDPKTNIKGAFICGDFYHFATHDTSVATAEIVAEMIAEQNV